MNTLDINTIAFQYLLRNNSLNNNSDESSVETVRYNPEQSVKTQKSLLFHLYDLEEEAENLFA
ncbi:hypothetical protein HNP37_000411 [Flavobacterium nitrogenifigens]|uniref:Uncharacterized protein n=2 Tax=Flavobacterium TaxID=237 RepID=A0A7W7N6L7_9FLAO|nr:MULTISPECIES: hypothetical protein [Flavobacterium]MBB4800372.1 hypothetical protein [Flavobacterium nitrogenifigens]MBB6385878.1 hypothetical protein [Flavobacterium notoginsengisoli]